MKITKKQKARILELYPNFFDLELGKWYKGNYGHDGVLIYFESLNDRGNIKGYGIRGDEWYDNRDGVFHYGKLNESSDWILATDKEVREALVKEARSRGFVLGCSWGLMTAHEGEDFHYDSNILRLQGGTVFYNGTWRTVNEISLEVGSWYSYPDFSNEFMFLYNGDMDSYQTGFDKIGVWKEDKLRIRQSETSSYFKVNEDEVALVIKKEARCRYKTGDRVQDVSSCKTVRVINLDSAVMQYYPSTGDLYFNGLLMYVKGKWAEIF